ncbi:erythromycin esterase family protein [Antarcticibacterium flavum]|uniref:Erythromycin esterase family protein n=1 Tax=Antarcticibacterium flavum TaxID=2058175 RepID=A0A5B7X7M0_9FLAO|nr:MULTISPECIES: erythromycin esterase family protein [Antarcticibacterium]MCM4159790.1 protein-L-isoaspartate O-methyltransferase [Antarcticibacterium sp. W02-3]QCY70718.1 erythromycin esterase family protein [Antarcticibacterium flavum]
MFSSEKRIKDTFYKRLETDNDLDPLMDTIGDASYVLLGEASHGTHEYYTWRAKITKRLILEKGFSFIAVEGDWPDCYRINKWLKDPNDTTAVKDVLSQFNRWPTWMWANWEIAALAGWLKDHNSSLPEEKKIGFYGLDVYSLWDSMEIMVNYLEKEDPKTAKLAKNAFKCFEPFKERDSYASVFSGARPGCRDEVIRLLQEVRENTHKYSGEKEADLNAEINSLVMANAEKYYRAMAGFGEDSWNVRDRHMVETLNSLMKYHGPHAKVIIWEHNTHVGDARATNMAEDGLVNVGQLVREQHPGEEVFIAGFGSYEGSVIAGDYWGSPMKIMKVPPAIKSSVEYKLHKEYGENALIIFRENEDLQQHFAETTGHRAIGVVYHPERERGNYVPSRMPQRYDAFLYLEETTALHPLKIEPGGIGIPDTYPFGI